MEKLINIEFLVTPRTNNVTFKYSGYDEQKLRYSDFGLFDINEAKLKKATNALLGVKSLREEHLHHFLLKNNTRCIPDMYTSFGDVMMGAVILNSSIFSDNSPSAIHLRQPATWNNEDVFDKCNAKPVTRVTSVKSVELISYVKKPLALSMQTFRNDSSVPIKVNTGLSHTVENTMTTAWSREHDLSIGQAFEYNVKVYVVNLQGTTTVGYSSKWGTSEQISNSVTVGTNTGTEIELAPGQAVTAILTANVVELEAQVTYTTSLRNRLVAIYDRKHNNKNMWSVDIREVMNSGDISNEVTFKENMKFNYYMEGSLEVHDAHR